MVTEREVLTIGGREVSISNPGKIYFPETGHTKLDLVRYYLAVADGALRGAGGRPMALKRFVDGAAGQPFFQKRAPDNTPDWIRTATLIFPSGRTADEIVIDEAAALAWIVNLGCIDLNPHPVRADDLDHPDELRVDLDPVPGVPWSQIRDVAMVCRDALDAVGLVGWPKTSGSRGIHINVRIEPRWTFPEVRRAALALARDVERRAPGMATSKWWKEERHGVFLDYNQNAKDRTVASAYSVRPLPDARVSTPLGWDEVPGVEAEAFTIDTVPARFGASAIRAPGSMPPSDRWMPCSSCRRGMSARVRATPRGHRTTPNRPASRRGSSRRGSADHRPGTRRGAARPADRHQRWLPSAPRPWPPVTPTRACRPNGPAHPRRLTGQLARSRPTPRDVGAAPSRSLRSPGLRTRRRHWPAWSAGRSVTLERPPHSSRRTSWSIQCAAGPRPGPAFAST